MGVVLLQTKSVLRHPVRLLQLFEAIENKHPLVCVNIKGGGYDFAAVKPLMHNLQKELPDFGTLRDALVESGQGVGHLVRRLVKAVPNTISVMFNPNSSEVMMDASIGDVVDKLGKSQNAAGTTEKEFAEETSKQMSVWKKGGMAAIGVQRMSGGAGIAGLAKLAVTDGKTPSEASAEVGFLAMMKTEDTNNSFPSSESPAAVDASEDLPAPPLSLMQKIKAQQARAIVEAGAAEVAPASAYDPLSSSSSAGDALLDESFAGDALLDASIDRRATREVDADDDWANEEEAAPANASWLDLDPQPAAVPMGALRLSVDQRMQMEHVEWTQAATLIQARVAAQPCLAPTTPRSPTLACSPALSPHSGANTRCVDARQGPEPQLGRWSAVQRRQAHAAAHSDRDEEGSCLGSGQPKPAAASAIAARDCRQRGGSTCSERRCCRRQRRRHGRECRSCFG